MTHFGGQKIIYGKRTFIARPKNEWLLVEVPNIISERTFLAAQMQKQENQRQKGRERKYKYLLSGVQKCGHCGNGVTGVTFKRGDKTWSYYKCNACHLPKRYGFKCDNKAFRADRLDKVVWGWIKSTLLDTDNLDHALEEYQNTQLEIQKPLIRLIEANQAKLVALEKQKERLITAYIHGTLSLDDIAAQKTEIDKQIANLHEAISSLQDELSPAMLAPQQIDEIHDFAIKIREGLEIAGDDFKAQQRIIRLLKTEITLSTIKGIKWANIKTVINGANLPAVGIASGHKVCYTT